MLPGSPLPLVLTSVVGGVAVVTVDTDGLPVAQRAQHYAMSINGLLETRTLTPEPRATLHGFHIGPLHIVFGEFSPRISRRTRALCARDRYDGIALQLVRSGRWHGRVAGRPVAGESGTSILLDFAQCFTVTNEVGSAFVMVMIPRSLAARLADNPADLHGRSLDVAAGGVLAGILGGLVSHAGALRADDGAALSEVLMTLLGLAFPVEDDRIGARPGTTGRLRERLERLVDMRLNAEDLSPDWIARKLGVSRTELYAAADGSGGIARLIWERRLVAARDVLADPSDDRTIGTIAHLFGFASNAHFSRAFKKRFGVTPTAARSAG